MDEEPSSTFRLSSNAPQMFTDSAPCSPSPATHRPSQNGENGGSQSASSPQPPASGPLSPQCTAQTEVGHKSPLRRSTEQETLKDRPMQAVHDEQTLERSDVCPAAAPVAKITFSQDGDSQVVPVQSISVQSSSALSLDQSSPGIPTPESLVHRSPSKEDSSLPRSPGQQNPQNLLEEKLADPLHIAGAAISIPGQGVVLPHMKLAEPSTPSGSLLQPEEALEVELSDQFSQVNQLQPTPIHPSNPSDSLDQVIVVPPESSSIADPQGSSISTDRSPAHPCQTSPFHTESERSTSTSPLPPSTCSQHWRPTETSAASTCGVLRPSDEDIISSSPRSSHITSSCFPTPHDVCISPPHSSPQANKMHCSPPHASGSTLGPMSDLAQGVVVASLIKTDNDCQPAVDNLDSSSVQLVGDHSPFSATSLPDRPSTPEFFQASAPDPDGCAGGAVPEGPALYQDTPVTSSLTQENSPFTSQGAASLAVSPQSTETSAICSPVGPLTEPNTRSISPAQPADRLETLQTSTAEKEKGQQQQQQVEEVKEQDKEQSTAHNGE